MFQDDNTPLLPLPAKNSRSPARAPRRTIPIMPSSDHDTDRPVSLEIPISGEVAVPSACFGDRRVFHGLEYKLVGADSFDSKQTENENLDFQGPKDKELRSAGSSCWFGFSIAFQSETQLTRLQVRS